VRIDLYGSALLDLMCERCLEHPAIQWHKRLAGRSEVFDRICAVCHSKDHATGSARGSCGRNAMRELRELAADLSTLLDGDRRAE
jgi:hypothetical protein